jgi:hypothetical protein
VDATLYHCKSSISWPEARLPCCSVKHEFGRKYVTTVHHLYNHNETKEANHLECTAELDSSLFVSLLLTLSMFRK